MILSDYHVHSEFSADCNIPMTLIIEYAIKRGISNLCFTDHHDLEFPYKQLNWELDIDTYSQTVLEMKEKYKNQINIMLGIEIGIQPHLHKELSTTINQYPFDFVLCSSHLANGLDPYDKTFYDGQPKQNTYARYFEAILQNVKDFTDYDTYGHLDYAIRYAPYKDRNYEYTMFEEILDEVLRIIIDNGKGIEVNSSGYKHGLNNPHPSIQVLKRYKELGGEIITLGSDAHKPEFLCSNFDLVMKTLKNIGFYYYTIYKNRTPQFIKF